MKKRVWKQVTVWILMAALVCAGTGMSSVMGAVKPDHAAVGGPRQDNNGCKISSVVMDDARENAIVSYEAQKDATIVVGIYDKEGIGLITAGSQSVSKNTTEARIHLDNDNLPQNFYLRAFMIDSDTLKPLCTAYTSQEYVDVEEEIQEESVVDVQCGMNCCGALTKNGSLYMWGDNFNGQLGDGTTEDHYTPVKVMDNVETFQLSSFYNGALKKDGSLWVWGDNQFGQWGSGTTENSSAPAQILDNVESFVLRGSYNGALKKDGSLWMWGDNQFGQLGNGTTENSSAPVQVTDNVETFRLWNLCAGALKKDGSLWMWGNNQYGQLGNGTTKNSSKPVQVTDNVETFDLVYKDYTEDSFCGALIKKDGSLWMWGDNLYGQWGDDPAEHRNKPERVLDNVETFCLGCDYGGALKKDGSLWMWGGIFNQQGDGTAENCNRPGKVLDNVETFRLGIDFGGAITKNGQLYMLGNNQYGQLGHDPTEHLGDYVVPVLDNVETFRLMDYSSGALKKDGSLYIWGWDFEQQGSTIKNIFMPKTKILDDVETFHVNGRNSGGAITKDGSLYMWGGNSYGQLGDGTTEDRLTPTKITILASAAVDSPSLKQSAKDRGSRAEAGKNLPGLKSFTVPSDVSATGNRQTASIDGLVPDSIYNFYILRSQERENLLDASNLLYINQYTADSRGSLNITYQTNVACDSAVQMPVGMEDKIVRITNITLSAGSSNLTQGATLQLVATVSPAELANQPLKWTSSDSAIATVDNKGLVTAKSTGEVTITAESTDGSNVKASCVIKVQKASSGGTTDSGNGGGNSSGGTTDSGNGGGNSSGGSTDSGNGGGNSSGGTTDSGNGGGSSSGGTTSSGNGGGSSSGGTTNSGNGGGSSSGGTTNSGNGGGSSSGGTTNSGNGGGSSSGGTTNSGNGGGSSSGGITNSGNGDGISSGEITSPGDGAGDSSLKIEISYYVVNFDKNGGKNLSRRKMTLLKDDQLGILPKAVRKNYKFAGWYTQKTGGSKVESGTVLNASTTLFARWTKLSRPSRVKITSVKAGDSGKLQVKYRKVSGVSGYEIVYSTSSKFTSSKTKKVSVTAVNKILTGLKKNQTYHIKVRAYKVDSAGNKVYGKYSKTKKVSTKK